MALPPPDPGTTCLITGASSGIGAEIAREMHAGGLGVTLVARREEKLTALANELKATGVRAEVLAADLADRGSRAELLERVEGLGLTPDILVNNAGLSTLGRVAKADPATEMNMIEVDVVAVADLCTRFLPGMVARKRGAILNVASTAAFQPLPGQAGYGAGKAFVLSYTQSLAAELRQDRHNRDAIFVTQIGRYIGGAVDDDLDHEHLESEFRIQESGVRILRLYSDS